MEAQRRVKKHAARSPWEKEDLIDEEESEEDQLPQQQQQPKQLSKKGQPKKHHAHHVREPAGHPRAGTKRGNDEVPVGQIALSKALVTKFGTDIELLLREAHAGGPPPDFVFRCRCGLIPVEKTVKKDTKNQGRRYLACCHGRKGCDLFTFIDPEPEDDHEYAGRAKR